MRRCVEREEPNKRNVCHAEDEFRREAQDTVNLEAPPHHAPHVFFLRQTIVLVGLPRQDADLEGLIDWDERKQSERNALAGQHYDHGRPPGVALLASFGRLQAIRVLACVYEMRNEQVPDGDM
jgi:hypothetical protein